jgi:CheY-like chemotaxis protein
MIVDFFMPRMRGFESIRMFHERAPSVPLIAISGFAFSELNSTTPDVLRMALRLGAAWATLLLSVNQPRIRNGLSRFARWSTLKGIPPEAVDDTINNRFIDGASAWQPVMTSGSRTLP